MASAHWMLDNMEHSVPPPGLTPDSLTFEALPPKEVPANPGTKEPAQGTPRKSSGTTRNP